jgi:hypothetical protein
MHLGELKAVMARTTDVALYPRGIELDHGSDRRGSRSGYGRNYCPIGLVRGQILALGVEWIESRTITGCDLHDYQIKHKNGVLMRVNPADWIKGWKGDRTTEVRHGEFVEVPDRDGALFMLDVVVSHKAVWTSWNDYALKMAEREKSIADDVAKQRRLREPQAAILGLTYDELKAQHDLSHNERNRRGITSLTAEWHDTYEFDEDGDYARNKDGSRKQHGEIGVLQLPLTQVEKILAMLTPTQRARL